MKEDKYMWYQNLFEKLESLKDEKQSIKMSAYMQNKFEFLGIPKPKLNEFVKSYLKLSKNYDLDWNFVNTCFDKNYREAQYIAIEYLNKNVKKILPCDFNKIKKLIITKSWWETVDSLDAIIGKLVIQDNNLEKEMLLWSTSDNIWLRRVAIDFQQKYKEKTNQELLKKIILNNLGTQEFFINKAIGWSLRDYSKVNPEWVKNFVKENLNKLDKLSVKEAIKYID